MSAMTVLKRLVKAVRPSLYPAWKAERRLSLPPLDRTALEHDVQNVQASLGKTVSEAQGETRDLVLLAVEHDRQRLSGLEGKGFAVAALPAAVAATSFVIVGANWAATICGCIVIGYAVCALASAARVIVPRPRAMFGVDDALGSDQLSRLVAVTKVNQPVAIAVNNRIVAAAWDTFRAFCVLIIGSATLLFNVDWSPGHAPPVRTSTAVSSHPMSTAATNHGAAPRTSAPRTTRPNPPPPTARTTSPSTTALTRSPRSTTSPTAGGASP